MWLIRFLFKDLYRSLIHPDGRRFMWLLFRYGSYPRNRPTTISFRNYRFDVPDAFSFVWQIKEIFADEFYGFKATTPQPVILDCGANIGTSITYFKQLYPDARIIAFEADAHIGQVLAQNLRQNNLRGVEIVNKAVWTHNNGVSFGSGDADAASIFSESDKTLVPSVRLRDYLLRESRIDMLKMDIEGAETDVIADCHDALANVHNVFIEYHSYVDHPQGLASIINTLEKNGFRYYIDSSQSRTRPLVNHRYSSGNNMDLQLNIFGFNPKLTS